MVDGSFTTRKLSDYFGPYTSDGGTDEIIPSASAIYNARQIVNGIVYKQAMDVQTLMLKYRGLDDGC